MTQDKDARIAALEAQLAERGKTEREIEYDVYSKIRLAFRRALSELPEIAPLEVSRVLSSVHMRDEFINEGKRIQQAHGTDAVAPRVEQECGAGAWSFMRKGILAALEATPPAPKVRWRAFEATTRGWWGIELEQSEDEDEPILYPIKARRDSIESIVNAHNSALEATPPAPKVTEAQAEVVAKLITKWLGRSWEGLPEGRVIEKGFPVFSHSQRGWGFNGRKGDMIDLAHEALTAAQEAAPKVTADTIDELRWIMQNLPVEFAMHERCPTDTLMHVITTLSAAQEAGKP